MKRLGTELKEFAGNVWGVLKELAGSRRAVLAALGSALSLLVVAVPELAKYQDAVYTKVDVFLGLLVILFGLVDAIEARNAGVGSAG